MAGGLSGGWKMRAAANWQGLDPTGRGRLSWGEFTYIYRRPVPRFTLPLQWGFSTLTSLPPIWAAFAFVQCTGLLRLGLHGDLQAHVSLAVAFCFCLFALVWLKYEGGGLREGPPRIGSRSTFSCAWQALWNELDTEQIGVFRFSDLDEEDCKSAW